MTSWAKGILTVSALDDVDDGNDKEGLKLKDRVGGKAPLRSALVQSDS